MTHSNPPKKILVDLQPAKKYFVSRKEIQITYDPSVNGFNSPKTNGTNNKLKWKFFEETKKLHMKNWIQEIQTHVSKLSTQNVRQRDYLTDSFMYRINYTSDVILS